MAINKETQRKGRALRTEEQEGSRGKEMNSWREAGARGTQVHIQADAHATLENLHMKYIKRTCKQTRAFEVCV